MRARPGAAGAAALAVLLAGCTVGPRFSPPAPPAGPDRFTPKAKDVPSRTTEAQVDAAWWRSFHDPELTSLVERLARENLDLRTAAERVLQARARRGIARAQGLPRVDGRASYVRERESKNGTVSLLEPVPGAPLEFDLDDTLLQASWELDLFGRVRREVEAQGAEVEAAAQDRRAMAVAAEADLASDYARLRGVQAREAVVGRNLAAADTRRRLVRDRLAHGAATLSDLAQADAQAAAIGEDLPSLRAEAARLVNALGLLLALPPGALAQELKPPADADAAQPAPPPAVPVGLPAQLLRRRPDLRRAEARLHAATARTGVAVADFYPDVTLTGNYGNEALGATHLFDTASRMFMVGPSVTLPIFQGGRLRSTLDLRRSEEREAGLDYRRAVLAAYRDVDDALSAYAEVQHRIGNIEGVVRDDRTALRVAEQRYREGVETFIDVTAAQADLFRAQDALAQARTDLAANLVALYRALGGGWEPVEPAPR